jgi:signal transduction histidine kinase
MTGTVRTAPAAHIGPGAASALRLRADDRLRSWTDATGERSSYAPGVPLLDAELFPRWTPAVTAGVAVVIAAGAYAQRVHTPYAALDLVLVVVAAAPWVLAMVRPLPLPVWFAVVLVATWGLVEHPTEIDFAPFFLILLVGTVATLASMRWSFAAAVVAAMPTAFLDLARRFDGSAIWVFATFFSWFFGVGFRWQLATLQQLAEAQAELAGKAAAGERQRLAYEVHDVVAHTMSVAMLHITGARLALVDGDLAEAEAGLSEAERSGREAMSEIRRSVGLLAPAADAVGAVPEEVDLDRGLADVARRFTEAGLAVDLVVDAVGPDLRVPAATADAVVRIAQEAVANAARHGDATGVAVHARRGAGHLVLEVRNRRRTATEVGTGVGTSSMRARAASVGGTCVSGPDGSVDEGWLVRVEVPV